MLIGNIVWGRHDVDTQDKAGKRQVVAGFELFVHHMLRRGMSTGQANLAT